MTSASGDVVYTGPLDKDNLPHGTGAVRFNDGHVFVGLFKNGTMRAGVLSSNGTQVVATMREGQWTPQFDQQVVDAFPLREAFTGPVRVTVQSAENLVNSDWLDKTDGLVIGEFRSTGGSMRRFQTPVVANKLNPIWDASFNLSPVGPRDTLTLIVRDSDGFQTDDDLGRVTVVFSSKLPTQLHLKLTGHAQERLNVKAAVASDPSAEAVVGEDCKQYIVGGPKQAVPATGSELDGGMRCSRSRAYYDSDTNSFVAWGSVVNALEAGNGWVKVCDKIAGINNWYLPKVSQLGEAVLLPFQPAAQDGSTSPLGGELKGPKQPKVAPQPTAAPTLPPSTAAPRAPASSTPVPMTLPTLTPFVLPTAAPLLPLQGTAAPSTTTVGQTTGPAMQPDVWATAWNDWNTWQASNAVPPQPAVPVVVTPAPLVAPPPVLQATVNPVKFQLSPQDANYETQLKEMLARQQSASLQVDSLVSVLVKFDTMRSCDASATVEGCTQAGATVYPGSTGRVLAPGPAGSLIIQFTGIGPPQLVLKEQIPSLGAMNPDNVCSHGEVRISQAINMELLSGLVGRVVQVSMNSNKMTVNFPSLNGTREIYAADFGKLGCSEVGYHCGGKQMVALQDLKLDSGSEILAGQWVALKQLVGDTLQVAYGQPQVTAVIPKSSFPLLACIASETLGAAQTRPSVTENDSLLGMTTPAQAAGPMPLQQRRRLSSATAPANHFRALAAVATPAWIPNVVRGSAPAPVGAQAPHDECSPPELAPYLHEGLEVVYSALVGNMSNSAGKEAELRKSVEEAINNATGASVVVTEFRNEGPRTVVMGYIRPRDANVNRQQVCKTLRQQSQSVLQTALALAEPQAKAGALQILATHFALQAVDLKRKYLAASANTKIALSFSVDLVNADPAVTSGAGGMDKVRAEAEKAIVYAAGRDVTIKQITIHATTTSGSQVNCAVTIEVATVEDAKTIAWRLRAVGAAYLQAILRHQVLGPDTSVAKIGQGVAEVQTAPAAPVDPANPGLSRAEMLLVELAGVGMVVPCVNQPANQSDNGTIPSPDDGTPAANSSQDMLPVQTQQYPLLAFPPPPPTMCNASAIHMYSPPLPALPPQPTYPIDRDEVERKMVESGRVKCCPEAEHLGLCKSTDQDSYTEVPVDIFNLSETLSCAVQDETWEPLDMPGAGPSEEVTIAACQGRCSLTKGCAHFSYWLEGGTCHLQNAFAYRTGNRVGFISGPPGCLPGQQSSEIVEIELMKRVCFSVDVSRVPLDIVGTQPREAVDVLTCQQRCLETPNCFFFTFNALSGICHLGEQEAQAVPNMVYYVSGPPACQEPLKLTFVVPQLDFNCLQSNELVAYEFESSVRCAIASASFGNITEKNVAVLPRPYEDEVVLPTGSSTVGTFVQVLIYPPNSVSYETVIDSLSNTEMVTSILQFALNKAHICTCKRGLRFTVLDVTVPVLLEDDASSLSREQQQREARIAALMNPGEAAAEKALQAQRMAEGPDGAIMSTKNILSRSQSGGELQVKSGKTIVDRIRVSGTAGTLLAVAVAAVVAATLLSVSAGTACSRAMSRWARAHRLEQVADPLFRRPMVNPTYQEVMGDYDGGEFAASAEECQALTPMPRINSRFRPLQPGGDDDDDVMRQVDFPNDDSRFRQRFAGLSSFLSFQRQDQLAGDAREVSADGRQSGVALLRASVPTEHESHLEMSS